MTTETVEMSSVNKPTAAAANSSMFVNRSNALVALIFAIIGISAAVGLGSGDWYAVEASTGVSPTGSSFLTAYYGLRLGYFCAGPQSTLPYTSLSQNNGFSNVPCSAYTYRSKYLAANYAHDAIQGTDSASQTAKDSFTDSSNAYYHLIGASGIITALLAVAVVISAHQFFVNAAHAHGIAAPHHIASRLSLVILIIIEALVIIFWITIFPYTYFYNYEPTLLNVPSYDVYHTIGLGLAIQFAGLLVGLFGFVSFPKDIVVLKNAV